MTNIAITFTLSNSTVVSFYQEEIKKLRHNTKRNEQVEILNLESVNYYSIRRILRLLMFLITHVIFL